MIQTMIDNYKEIESTMVKQFHYKGYSFCFTVEFFKNIKERNLTTFGLGNDYKSVDFVKDNDLIYTIKIKEKEIEKWVDDLIRNSQTGDKRLLELGFETVKQLFKMQLFTSIMIV